MADDPFAFSRGMTMKDKNPEVYAAPDDDSSIAGDEEVPPAVGLAAGASQQGSSAQITTVVTEQMEIAAKSELVAGGVKPKATFSLKGICCLKKQKA